jgi:hypothetical protein
MRWVHGAVDQDGRCGALVHRGPGGGATHWGSTCGWLWAWLLAVRAPRGRGSRGEPHRGRRWVARGRSEAGGYLLSTKFGAALDAVESG